MTEAQQKHEALVEKFRQLRLKNEAWLRASGVTWLESQRREARQ